MSGATWLAFSLAQRLAFSFLTILCLTALVKDYIRKSEPQGQTLFAATERASFDAGERRLRQEQDDDEETPRTNGVYTEVSLGGGIGFTMFGLSACRIEKLDWGQAPK